ncbi:hypothetical protein C8T65DRAFT_730511 [Cerioporus squamosus]|nr:hypothetical protein C8T65DRAFT_730511 [Cerioporus squamosus]
MSISTSEVDDCFFCSCSFVAEGSRRLKRWLATYQYNSEENLPLRVLLPWKDTLTDRVRFYEDGFKAQHIHLPGRLIHQGVTLDPSFTSGDQLQGIRHPSVIAPIVASFPGGDVGQPARVSLLIDVKATKDEDPFGELHGLRNCKSLLNTVYSARVLMQSHSLLAAFVVGIYGDTARIARVDTAALVVSGTLSLREQSDVHLLKTFFWNFVHPCEDVPFVGWDPTVRLLRSVDEEWLRDRLNLLGRSADISNARSISVYSKTGEQASYIIFKSLASDHRLFSRSTAVWLGIRDTRLSVGDHSVDDLQFASPRVQVIKDAWRPLDHRSEDAFYDRLVKCIPEEEQVGLPHLVCGRDLGEREVRLWEDALYGVDYERTPLDEDSHHRSRLRLRSVKTLDTIPFDAPASLLATTSRALPPRHRPHQQTFSWRTTRGSHLYERSHVRIVVDTVGRPLTQFRSTKELVTALRDAVFGFLHDFDYSSMSAEPPNLEPSSPASWAKLSVWLQRQTRKKSDSGRTDQVHNSGDDLESFYWVLVWVVIAHTAHNESSENWLHAWVFPAPSDFTKQLGAKHMWLIGEMDSFSIPNNPPLEDLIKQFGNLVLEKAPWHPLDYGEVIDLLTASLARDDWPEGDAAVPYTPKPQVNSGSPPALPHKRTCCKERPARAERARSFAEWEASLSDDADDSPMPSDASEQWVEYHLFAERSDSDGDPFCRFVLLPRIV